MQLCGRNNVALRRTIELVREKSISIVFTLQLGVVICRVSVDAGVKWNCPISLDEMPQFVSDNPKTQHSECFCRFISPLISDSVGIFARCGRRANHSKVCGQLRQPV